MRISGKALALLSFAGVELPFQRSHHPEALEHNPGCSSLVHGRRRRFLVTLPWPSEGYRKS